MLTRLEFLAVGTAAAALAAAPSGALAQTPRTHQTMPGAILPTSPTPVSPRPADNLGGSTINVGSNPRDLQTAINASAQGDTLVCPVGVTYNPITLPARTGSGWTCIRTSGTLTANQRVSPANAGQMFKVLGDGAINTSRAVTIPVGTQGWRFIGMEATHPNDTAEYGLIDADGTRMSFERCYIHGRPTQTFMARCFFVHGNDFQIWDSWVSEAQALGQDAQCLFTRNNARFHVENCELQGTGENIMLGDQGSTSPTLDSTIKRNHFLKALTWRKLLYTGAPNPSYDGQERTIKNLFEIKWAHRVLLEGNVFENNWGSSQDGTAWLLNTGRVENTTKDIDAIDVMFRSNTTKNSPYGITVGMSGASLKPPSRIAFLNNLFLEVGGRVVLLNHRADDVWFEHNTCVPLQLGNTQARLGWGPQGSIFIAWDVPGCFPRFTLKRNVFGAGQYGIFLQGLPTTNGDLDRIIPDRSWANNAQYDFSGPAPSGVTYYPSANAAGIDTVTGRLNAGSPLIGGAGDGKDIGVDFVQLAAAQAGT